MTMKRLLFCVMCTLLVLVVITACIAMGKVNTLLQSILPGNNPTKNTTNSAPSTNTGSTEGTDNTDSSDSTQATKPSQSTKPTQPPAPHEHSFTNVAKRVKPTCTTFGFTEYECSCGRIQISDYRDALGHNYSIGEEIAPTCTEKGYTQSLCTRCGDLEKAEETPALGHTYDTGTETAPTCTEDACILYKCLQCDAQMRDQVQEGTAFGHNFGLWTETPTGEYQRTCGLCGEIETPAEPFNPNHSLKITDVIITDENDGTSPYVLYQILVGTEEEPSLYTYRILDYMNNGSLLFTYDPVNGLCISYDDGGDSTTYCLPPEADGSYTIDPIADIPPEETDPAPDPGTDPTEPRGTDPDPGTEPTEEHGTELTGETGSTGATEVTP